MNGYKSSYKDTTIRPLTLENEQSHKGDIKDHSYKIFYSWVFGDMQNAANPQRRRS